MKLSTRLTLTGILLYLLFLIPVLWQHYAHETSESIFDSNKLSGLTIAGFVLPGLLMGMAWIWKDDHLTTSNLNKIFFLSGCILLYVVVPLAGMDDPMALALWCCLCSIALLLLHHYFLQAASPLPGLVLRGIFAAATGISPLLLCMYCFRLEDEKLLWVGFLSFPLWGYLMGKTIEKSRK